MERDTLNNLINALPVSRRRRKAIARELQGHLEETRLELKRAGWSPEAADRESLLRLGDPAEIADGFGHVYRPARRRRVGLAFGLAGALLLGAYGGGTLASATSVHKTTPHATTSRVAPAHHCHHL